MFFSIIIPVYNAEMVIGRCLDSLARQTFQDFEVIMVNDGSFDQSEKIIREFMLVHDSINLNLLNQINTGAGAARNAGIAKANGDFIVFIDSDDYVEPDYLENIYATINVSNADVVFIDIIREQEDGSVIRKERMSQYAKLRKERLIRWQLTGKVPWGGVRKVVRASIIRGANVEYGKIKVGEESIFSFRVLSLAEKIAFQPNAVYHYVDTATSLTSKDEICNSLKVYNYMKEYFIENNIFNQYAPSLRAMAITTMSIAINVASKSKSFKEAYLISKNLLQEYKSDYSGVVDKDALEWRVKICYPWIKLGMTFPILIASRVQSFIK